jgi:hypothetical protein
MWGVLIQLGIWAALYVGNRLLTPKPKHKPLTRENVELPRTEEGSPVPIVYGRTRVQSPLLIWNSSLQTKTVDNSNNGSQYNVFAVDLLFCVGIPMGSGVTRGNSLAGPRLHKVWLGDNLLPKPNRGSLPAAGTSAILYSQMVFRPQLLGGPGSGGGLIGAYSFYGGYTDQNLTSPASRIGDMMTTDIGDATLIPGHRRQMLLALHKYPKDTSDPYFASTGGDGGSGTHESVPYPERGFILGESPNIDGISCEVSCYGDGGAGTGGFSMNGANPGVDYGGCADPIEVIVDLMSNTWARAGISTSKIDLTSAAAASATLKAEGHGWSGVVYDAQDVASTVQEILRQIDCAFYEEPSTGQMTFKLIRNDFNPLTVPAFTEDGIISVDDFGVGGFKETVNEVRVVYTDRTAEYKPGIAVAQSIANAIGNNNRRRSRTIEYPGIHNANLAAAVAARDLNVLSRPLARIKLTLDRSAHRLRPGSVFKVTYAKYTALAAGMYFRVKSIDHGQLFSNKVVIEAVQDPFATTYQGLGADWQPPNRIDPYPLHDRTVVEAPLWLSREAATSGLLTDPETSHLLSMPRRSKNATQFSVATRGNLKNKFNNLINDWQTDIPLTDFPAEFTVAIDYPRELEPYDTTTGLIVENLLGLSRTMLILNAYGNVYGTGTDIFTATASQIADDGRNMICLITSSGEMEFIAFESMSDLGNGRYRLNNVWRGLMDTPPIKHVAGGRGVWVHPNMVGRRAWNITRSAVLWMTPRAPMYHGSGEDPEDVYVGKDQGNGRLGSYYVAMRGILPLPYADIAAGNDGVPASGTLAPTAGLPSVAGYYKYLPLLEEGVDLIFRSRDRMNPKLIKGSDSAEAYSEYSAAGYTALPLAVPSGLPVASPNTMFVTSGTTATTSPSLRWKVDGYGLLDITNQVRRTVLAGDPMIGKAGTPAGIQHKSWTDPRVTAFMPSWRNLLANCRWSYSLSSEAPWDNATWTLGAMSIGAGTSSIYLSATARYLLAGSASFRRGQDTSISKWNPRGLTAIGLVYIRNFSADANDTAQISLDAYASPAGGSLGSATSVAAAGPTTTWTAIATTLTVPATTATISTKLIATEVAVGGTANADVGFVEPELRVGQWVALPATFGFATNSFANHSFEAGTTASWTVASGTWAAQVAAGPSNYTCTITNAGNGSIYQEYTLPAGAEYGSNAHLIVWAKQQTPAQGTFQFTLAAMDGSSNVLASSTTGVCNTPAGEWKRYALFVQIPDGSTKVRLTVAANYISGADPSFRFDEAMLYVVKDMDPRTSLVLDWSAPSKHDMPATWQQFALTLPTAIGRYADYYRGHPRTAQQMTNAVTWDTLWVAGWMLDETASPCVSAFAQTQGSPTSTTFSFATSAGAPTFGADGPRGYPDKSIKLAGATAALSAGNIFPVGTADFLIAGTIRFDSLAQAGIDIIGKSWAGASAPGYVLVRESNALKMYVSDGVTQTSCAATGIVVNTWYAFLVAVNRSTNTLKVSFVPVSGYQSAAVATGSVSIAGIGTFTNAGSLKIGAQVYNQTDFSLGSLYMSDAVGACGSIGSNVTSAVKAFAASISPALDVPNYVFGGTDFNGEQVEWTDGVAHTAAKVVGQFGAGVSSVSGYEFTRASGAAAVHAAAKWTTKSTVGNFKLSEPFTAVVFFRVNEPGLSVQAGLFGRMDLTAGWGLSISAAGQVTALLRGAGATSASVSTGRVSSEGGLRMAALVNDPGTGLLWVYDDTGGVAVSTASLGAIDRIASACHIRLGRDVDDHDVLPGQIARAYLWKAALTSSEIRSIWNYARDPNSKITTYTRTNAAWAFGPPDAAGITAYTAGANQIAIPYHVEALTAGTGYGLAVGASITNLAPSNNFFDGNWVLDAGSSRVAGVITPTGLARGAQISGNATNSISLANVPLAASPTSVTVVFVARLVSGGPNMTLKLRNSSSVLKGTATAVVLTSLWQRFVVNITGWDASTANGRIEFNPSSGATVWEIGEVLSVSQGTEVPVLVPVPGFSTGDYNALIDATKTYGAQMPVQFNSEGELIVQGIAFNTPTNGGNLIQVKNPSNNNNRRELFSLAGASGLRSAHYDGAGTVVNSDIAYTTWGTRMWRMVSRWNRFGMLDGGTAEFMKAAWTDKGTITNQLAAAGRNATWSMTTELSSRILVGGSAGPTCSVLANVILHAREEKYV